MAMTVTIQCLTGPGPASADVSMVVMSREDSAVGTTGIPVPTATGTNFSWVKSLIINISATGGLSMTNAKVGKVANEAYSGYKLWHVTSHALGSYVQATTSPTSTVDNNVTAPTLNTATASAVLLTTSPPSVYAAGPYNTVGQKGNLVEVSLGIDATATQTGTNVSVATMRWSWSEA